MKIKVSIIILLTVLCGHLNETQAQKISIGTNLVDWANLGTANLEVGASVSQHFSLMAGARYNPWEFKTPKGFEMYNRQTTGYIGTRYWPWYVFSGWWAGAKVQYSSFSKTGLWRAALEEGKSIGAGLSFGYTVMLHEHVNIEFGAGLWGGRHFEYALYECPRCMQIREIGPKYFIAPDDISVSIMFVF